MNIKEIAKKFERPPTQFLKRTDGRIEWICKHGTGHTIWAPNGNLTHGCDGCCKQLFECELKWD